MNIYLCFASDQLLSEQLMPLITVALNISVSDGVCTVGMIGSQSVINSILRPVTEENPKHNKGEEASGGDLRTLVDSNEA